MRLIDVSNVQGHPNWSAVVHQGGVHAAWIKASEGVTFNDPDFAWNRDNAAHVGVHIGPYHFARPDNNSPLVEAKHFVKVVGKLRAHELRAVLDYEVSTHMTPAEHLAWIRKFNGFVHDELGSWPLFYSYPALIEHMGLKVPVGDGLWLASYGRNDGLEHPAVVPLPWKHMLVHQFTSRGHVPGVNGDVDLSDSASLTPLLAHPLLGRVTAPLMVARRAGTRTIAA